MKIDSAINDFLEKYDRDAINSITEISKDIGLHHNQSTIEVFSIQEGFDKFNEYLQGYASYKIDNIGNEEASPQSAICESVSRYIDTQLFESKQIPYSELPSFVTSYLNGVKTLLETVENVKGRMMDADVDNEDIGNVNEFADQFMDKLHESFDPAMDKILWASGYNSKKALYSKNKSEPKPIFL